MKKIWGFFKNNIIFILFLILFILVKTSLMYKMPIVALYGAGEDDGLMIKLAQNIINGKWLGDYSYNTLMKGPIFPLFLSIIFKYKQSYMLVTSIFYSFSVLVFIFAIKKKYKNKFFLVLLSIVLLFNPIAMCSEIAQRVYRNVLTPAFSLIIVGGYLGIFYRRNDKIRYWLFWNLIECINLPLFYYSREDTIWILPFVIFLTISIIVGILLKKDKKIYELLIKLLLMLLPIICLMGTNKIISYKNEKVYGYRITNTLKDSSFANAMKMIYDIKPEVEIDKVNLPKEKVARLSLVSQNFAIIAPRVNNYIDGYGLLDSNPNDGELEDGWILWALRASAFDCAYDSIEKEEVLWSNIAHEIDVAIHDGRLELNRYRMPTAMMSPWRMSYTNDFFDSLLESITYVATFKDVYMFESYKSDNSAGTDQFKKICNDEVIYSFDENNCDINNKDYMKMYESKLKIINNNSKIYSLISPIFGGFAVIAYFILTIKIIIDLINKKSNYIEEWIGLSGIIGALSTLYFGIAYNNVCTAYSIKVLYLGGAHALYLAFVCIGFYTFIKFCRKIYYLKREKNERINEKM